MLTSSNPLKPQAPSTLSYNDVAKLYDALTEANPDLKKFSVKDISGVLNEATGTKDFDAGVKANWAQKYNYTVNKYLDKTGAPELLGNVGAKVGGVLGSEEAGRAAGQGIPRAAAGLALGAAAVAAAPETMGGSLLALAPLAADTTLQTYAETGSPVQAAVQGGSTLALGKAGELGASVVGKGLSKVLPTANPLLEKVAEYIGANTSVMATQEAAKRVGMALHGDLQQAFAPPTKEDLVGMAVGQLPFLAFDAATGTFRTPKTPEGQAPTISTFTEFYRQEAQARIAALAKEAEARFLRTSEKLTEHEFQGQMPFMQEPMAPVQKAITDLPGEQNPALIQAGKLTKNLFIVESQIKMLESELASKADQPLQPGDATYTRLQALKKVHKELKKSLFEIELSQKPQKEPEQLTLFGEPVKTQPDITASRSPFSKSAEESAAVFEEVLGQEQALRQSPLGASSLSQQLTEQTRPKTVPPLQQDRKGFYIDVPKEWVKPTNTKGGEKENGVSRTEVQGTEKPVNDAERVGTSELPSEAERGQHIQGSEPDRTDVSGGKQSVGEQINGGQGALKIQLDPAIKAQVEESKVQPVTSLEKAKTVFSGNNKVVDTIKKVRRLMKSEYDMTDMDLNYVTDDFLRTHIEQSMEKGATQVQAVRLALEAGQQEFIRQSTKAEEVFKEAEQDPTTASEYRKLKVAGEAENSLSPEYYEAFHKILQWAHGQEERGAENFGYVDGVYSGLEGYLRGGKASENVKQFASYLMKSGQNGYLQQARKSGVKVGEETVVNPKTGKEELKPIYAQKTSLDRELGEGEEGSTLSDLLAGKSKVQQERENENVLERTAFQRQLDKDFGDDIVAHHVVTQQAAEKVRAVSKALESLTLQDVARIRKAAGFGEMRSEAQLKNFMHRVQVVAQHLMVGASEKETAHALKSEQGKPLSVETVGSVRKDVKKFLAEYFKEKGIMGPKEGLPTPQAVKTTADVYDTLIQEVISEQKKWQRKPAAESGDPGALPATAFDFFSRYFRELGYAENSPEYHALLDSAVRSASMIKESGTVRIGELIRKEGQQGGAIGLAHFLYGQSGEEAFSRIISLIQGHERLTSSKEVDAFIALVHLNHEIFHSFDEARTADPSKKAFSSEMRQTLDDMYDYAALLTKEEKAFTYSQVLNLAIPKELREKNPDVQKLVKGLGEYAATSDTEFLASLSGLSMMGLASKKSRVVGSYTEFLAYAPKALGDFLRASFFNLAQSTKAVISYLKTFKGPVDVGSAGTYVPTKASLNKIGRFLQMHSDAIQSIARNREQIDRATRKLYRMVETQPENIAQLISRNRAPDFSYVMGEKSATEISHAVEIPNLKASTEEELYGKNPGLWSLSWSNQFAEKFPVVGPIMELAHSFRAISEEAVSRTLAPFMTKVGKDGTLVRDNELSGIKSIASNERALKAVNDLFRWQNENEKMAGPEEFKKFLGGLSTETQGNIKNFISNTSQAMLKMAQMIITSKKNTLANTLGFVAMRTDAGMKYDVASRLGQQFVGAQLLRAVPETAVQGQIAMQTLVQQYKPEVIAALEKTGADLASDYAAAVQSISNRPWYTPETRRGDFIIRFVQNGKESTIALPTSKEATARYNQLSQDPSVTGLRTYQKSASSEVFDGVSDRVVEAFAKFDQKAFDHALRSVNDPDSAKVVQQLFQPGRAILEEIKSRGYRKNLQTRKLSGGREEVNIMQEVFNYVQSMSSGLAKTYVREQMLMRSNDPSVANEPRLRNEAVNHVENVINPPGKEFPKLKEWVFQYYMGANLSSAMTELFQPMFSLAPYLTEKGAGFAKGYKYIGEATKQIMGAYTKGSFEKATSVEDFIKLVGDKELAQGLWQAKQDRKLDYGVLNEFAVNEDLNLLNLKAMTDGNSPFESAKGIIQKPIYEWFRLMRRMYSSASNHNNLVAYISAYKAAKEGNIQGVGTDHASAHAFAERAVDSTMFGGGKANRPVGMHRLGKAQSVAGVMLMLQGYTGSMLSMMARLSSDSLSGSGHTPAEIYRARKALGQMVGTQVVMAGALGLPFVGASLAAIQAIFPQWQLQAGLRQALASLGGEDSQMGSLVADVALKGLPTAFSGIDMSARLGLSNIMGTNPYNGFDAGQAFLGAAGNIPVQMVLGLKDMAQGNIGGGTRMLPVALRNLADTYLNDSTGRDRQGNLLFEPTESEKVLSALGFRPNRLSQEREKQSLIKQATQANALEMRQFVRGVADQLMAGDVDGARQSLIDRTNEDHEFSPQAALEAAVKMVQNRTVPEDSLQAVNLQTAQQALQIAKTFPQQSRRSQTDLLVQRKQLEAQVGLPYSGQIMPAALSHSQMLDYLMSSYGITKSQAEALLNRRLPNRPALLDELSQTP